MEPDCVHSPPGPSGVAYAIDGTYVANRLRFPECQAPHTIRLSNDAGESYASGALAEVEPGRTTRTLRAKVYDSNDQLVPNVPVRLELNLEANSGGHAHHDDRRPTGLLSIGFAAQTAVEWNTGINGMPFRFLSPEVSGDHKIKATCIDRPCTQEGPDTIWVGIKGLQPIPASPNYMLIPNADTAHPDNHYLTPAASATIRTIANVYRSRFPSDPVLHLNDASLERGGLFDNRYDVAAPRAGGNRPMKRIAKARASTFGRTPSGIRRRRYRRQTLRYSLKYCAISAETPYHLEGRPTRELQISISM